MRRRSRWYCGSMYDPMNSLLNGIDDPILFKNKSSILVLADSMGPKIARTGFKFLENCLCRCFLPVVNLLITNKTKNRDLVWKLQPEFQWNIDFLCSFRFRTQNLFLFQEAKLLKLYIETFRCGSINFVNSSLSSLE